MKLKIFAIIMAIILSFTTISFAERLVDIPVPPNSSINNYLKSLSVEGYELTPEFNRQQDTYTIYVKDDSINSFNVLAEPDDETAKIDGIGNVTISAEQRIINIKVTAENGDLKVYTIKVENEENKKTEGKSSINFIVIAIIIVIIIAVIVTLLYKKKNNK